MTDVKAALKHGGNELRLAGIENPSLDASILLMEVSGLSKTQLLTESRELDSSELSLYEKLLERRKNGEPTAYILGRCCFMDFCFKLTPGVLIPRPDTECLVEAALLKLGKNALVLEIGTGSGCIAVSIAKYLPDAEVVSSDICEKALAVALENAEKNRAKNVSFVRGNLFEGFGKELLERADMIISNPPYIPSETIEELDKSVKDYEPRLALDGGTDGLDFYKIIAEKAHGFLKHGGVLMLEIGYDQKSSVTGILRNNSYMNIDFGKDLGGHDRVIWGFKA